jgi:uncharacterized Zn finger protein (UPF0148 family)
MLRYCPNCGEEQEKGVIYCPFCGIKYEEEEQVDQKDIEIQQLQQQVSTLENKASNLQNQMRLTSDTAWKARRSQNYCWWCCGCLILLMVITLVVTIMPLYF